MLRPAPDTGRFATRFLKFIGFLAGGTVMIWALGAIADGGWTWRRLVTAFLVAFVIGAVFDLPFEDLVLPPNGDV